MIKKLWDQKNLTCLILSWLFLLLSANFATDYLRKIYSVDIALLNAGCFSTVPSVPPGEVNLELLCQIFKFHDPIVVVQVSGKQLWEAIENGLKHLPSLHGSFPHVSF